METAVFDLDLDLGGLGSAGGWSVLMMDQQAYLQTQGKHKSRILRVGMRRDSPMTSVGVNSPPFLGIAGRVESAFECEWLGEIVVYGYCRPGAR